MKETCATIGGLSCTIRTSPKAHGFDYQVRVTNSYTICSGWVAGNRKETIEEAKQYAAERLAHFAKTD